MLCDVLGCHIEEFSPPWAPLPPQSPSTHARRSMLDGKAFSSATGKASESHWLTCENMIQHIQCCILIHQLLFLSKTVAICWLFVLLGQLKFCIVASSYTHWTLHSWPTSCTIRRLRGRLRGVCRKMKAKYAYASLRPPANCLHPTMCRSILAKIFACKKKLCSNGQIINQ